MKRDTAHLIQTLNVPLVIFFVPPQARRLKCVAEKTFLQNEIHIYNKRIFLANKAYRIPSGHKYVLFSTQVNFFSLDVVDEGLDIPSDYINPIKTVVTKLPYTIERPPQTPYIEEEEREITISFSQPLQLPPNSPPQIVEEVPIVEEPMEVVTNLEKNIVLVSPDFMAHFQSVMKKREMTDPYALKIVNDGPNPEPLDLSLPREDLTMDFSDLMDFSSLNVPDEELDSIIQDLWSPNMV